MKNNIPKNIVATGIGAMVLMTGCNKSEKQWKTAPGTRGFINLDAVKSAFQNNPDVAGFEKKVNDIFEGDNLILIDSEKISNGFRLVGKEDLDKDKIPSAGDESLFTLTVAERKATLKGLGINSYYKESWVYKPKEERKDEHYYGRHYHRPHFHYWYFGRSWGRYYTPQPRYDELRSHRKSYRQSNAYASQVANNQKFENRISHKYGAGFRKGIERNSSIRQSYINKTISNGAVPAAKSNKAISKRSSSSKSSAFSTKSSSSNFGRSGFRGSSGFGV